MENIQTNRDLAVQIFKILYARSDGTPEGILEEFHKAFVEFKQLSNSDFKETDHPRDEAGKFTDKGASRESATLSKEVQTKIDSVKIDFTRDNILPELNKEDLEELGIKSKPVLVSKRMLDRNKQAHKEISEKEYSILLSIGLYNNQYIFKANPEKPNYYHFIGKLEDGKHNAGIIIELAETKENFEVVHITKLRDKSVEQIKKRDG